MKAQNSRKILKNINGKLFSTDVFQDFLFLQRRVDLKPFRQVASIFIFEGAHREFS